MQSEGEGDGGSADDDKNLRINSSLDVPVVSFEKLPELSGLPWDCQEGAGVSPWPPRSLWSE